VRWTIEYACSAEKHLRSLDRPTRQRILDYLDQRIAPLDDPRSIGKCLKGELSEYWRYRIGDYRLICEIHDETIVVLVLRIGHRKEVYR
jgi:mRNA interferase RelE/StbE